MSHKNGIEIIAANRKAAVLLPLVFRTPFDYRLPESMDAQPGDYVLVPFGNKHVWGVVWGKAEGHVEDRKLKTVERMCAHLPPMGEAMRAFIDWVAWYTLSPAGQVLKMAMPVAEALEPPVTNCRLQVAGEAKRLKMTPARLRIMSFLSDGVPRTAKEISVYANVSPSVIREFTKAGGLEETVQPATTMGDTPPPSGLRPYFPAPSASTLQPAACNLSTTQQEAASAMRDKLGKGFSVTLLDGVTGSGKTEVYFTVIEECLKQGNQTLVMLPEIALSVQWLGRFEQHFGFAPHAWHSGVTQVKKRACWRETD